MERIHEGDEVVEPRSSRGAPGSEGEEIESESGSAVDGRETVRHWDQAGVRVRGLRSRENEAVDLSEGEEGLKAWGVKKRLSKGAQRRVSLWKKRVSDPLHVDRNCLVETGLTLRQKRAHICLSLESTVSW